MKKLALILVLAAIFALALWRDYQYKAKMTNHKMSKEVVSDVQELHISY